MLLSRLIKILYCRVSDLWLNFKLQYCLKTGSIKQAQIQRGDQLGVKVLVFKSKSEEIIELQDIYGFCRSGQFTVNCPEVDVWEFQNALCFADTDFVILNDNKAFWQKYYAYNYSHNIVLDKALVKEEKGHIYYRKPKKIHEVNCGFSLIGVFAHIWSHSLSEHYLKLSVLDNIVRDSSSRITVMVPNYTDQQLKQIVYHELNKYDIDILVVNKGEAVKCKNLYYMERPAFFTDHEYAVSVGDNVQPKIVADTLKSMLVEPMVKDCPNDEPIKLYLPRRGAYRALTNNDEVEAYFKQQGFVFLEPHKITLEEKIRIFRSAEVVVGPYSSAFSNLIFCKPNTKVLILSNFYRAFESWLVMHKQHFNMDMLWLTGYDDKKAHNPAHCCFWIPLEKIKAAAVAHGILKKNE